MKPPLVPLSQVLIRIKAGIFRTLEPTAKPREFGLAGVTAVHRFEIRPDENRNDSNSVIEDIPWPFQFQHVETHGQPLA